MSSLPFLSNHISTFCGCFLTWNVIDLLKLSMESSEEHFLKKLLHSKFSYWTRSSGWLDNEQSHANSFKIFPVASCDSKFEDRVKLICLILQTPLKGSILCICLLTFFLKKKVKGSMLYQPFDISSQKVKALSKNMFSLFKFLLLSSYLILFRGFSQPGVFAY